MVSIFKKKINFNSSLLSLLLFLHFKCCLTVPGSVPFLFSGECINVGSIISYVVRVLTYAIN